MKPGMKIKSKSKPIKKGRKGKKAETKVVFDEEDRKKFLQNFHGAKHRRREYAKKKSEREEREMLRQQKAEIKKQDAELIEKYKQILEDHEKELDELRQIKKDTKKVKMVDDDDEEIEVTTTFLK
eukprot:TRINITY_DN6729_c0_g1_i4.p2 TRINITY_DN6729_c0_g1~~TRINITY_DN6729_c0_g1_i4.p2  ORF type:complete len:125 (+),score=39.14 TRINITY_DN6729_c0_g1_i4:69-443(+)